MRPTQGARSAATVCGLAALLLFAVTVRAQEGAPAPPAAPAVNAGQAPPGPLVVERVRDRYVFAPEAKVTEFDNQAAALVGGYGGVLLQGSVLVGGAVYTMPNGPGNAELTYGGLLLGLAFGDERRLTYGVRGLIGIGNGELTSSIRFGVPARPMPKGPSSGNSAPDSWVVRDVRFDETFMVLEPQAEVALKLSDNWRIAFGAGYRFTNATDSLDERVNGATGSVAIVFGRGR